MAPTSTKRAGKVVVPRARLTTTRPSSRGWRRASSTAVGNSPISSRKRTPPWARLISPGRIHVVPPPIIATAEALWCGARNGGRVTSPVVGSPSPATEWTRVASREVARSRGGSRSGRRVASMVFPEPGGPTIRRWWPPVAATSRARRARRCPRMSARSLPGGSGTAALGPPGTGGGASSHRRCPRRPSTRRRRVGAERTRPCPQTVASARLTSGTTRTRAREGLGEHQGPRRSPERPVEAELADEGHARHRLGRDLARGDQEADGDGQVESGAALPDPRRRQVDGHAPEGPREAAREQGGPHAVAGLPDGGVGQADHGEAGEAVGHVDLDPDRLAVHTDEDGGGDGGDHGASFRHGPAGPPLGRTAGC